MKAFEDEQNIEFLKDSGKMIRFTFLELVAGEKKRDDLREEIC